MKIVMFRPIARFTITDDEAQFNQVYTWWHALGLASPCRGVILRSWQGHLEVTARSKQLKIAFVVVFFWIELYSLGMSTMVWQGCETNFLSLGPDVISLTSIWLTTGPISQSYLGPAITSTCGPLVANHPQMGHSSETPPNVAFF